MDEKLRRVLGLVIQILAEMRKGLRPESNIREMRQLLAGGTSGRDDWVVTEAVATALAHRALDSLSLKRDFSSPEAREAYSVGFQNRRSEFRDLFELARRCEPSTLALHFEQACLRFATVERLPA